MLKIDIPKELAHLKIDERGYPIPFFVPIKDGKPQFVYMDGKKWEIAIAQKLCHVCGKKLNKDVFYFISGPAGYSNKVSSDAPMHKVCAEFSLRVCPHMKYWKAERKDNSNSAIHAPWKPDVVLLIKSDKLTVKFHAEANQKLIHYRSTGVETYVYRDNILVKESDLK